MGSHTIVLGSELADKEQEPVKIRLSKQGAANKLIRLITPAGDVVSIRHGDIVHQWKVDGGGDLKRYAIRDDAIVYHELKISRFANPFSNKRVAMPAKWPLFDHFVYTVHEPTISYSDPWVP